jgi:hypothetical protein
VHDFNPGILKPSGLFWTTPIDGGSVRISLSEGEASLHLADLDIEDYGNVVNALKDGTSVPARVSLDLDWSGIKERVKIRNRDTGFAGEYIRNAATLVWSAEESGFSFESEPQASDFATIGHERNGVFFREDETEQGDDD